MPQVHPKKDKKRQKKKKKERKKQTNKPGSSHCGLGETNPTNIQEDVVSIPGLTQWVKDLTLP